MDAEPVGNARQHCKFYMRIAKHTGVRRAPGAILRAERLDHLALELPGTILYRERNFHLLRYRFGSFHRRFVRGGEADHNGLYVKALLAQDLDAGRRIHPAGQSDKNLILCFKCAETGTGADLVCHRGILPVR